MSGSLGFGGSTSIVMQRVGINILDLGRGLAGAIDRFETGVRDLAKHPDARDASWAALFEALNERRGRERELAACALGHRRVGLAVSEQHLGRLVAGARSQDLASAFTRQRPRCPGDEPLVLSFH